MTNNKKDVFEMSRRSHWAHHCTILLPQWCNNGSTPLVHTALHDDDDGDDGDADDDDGEDDDDHPSSSIVASVLDPRPSSPPSPFSHICLALQLFYFAFAGSRPGSTDGENQQAGQQGQQGQPGGHHADAHHPYHHQGHQGQKGHPSEGHHQAEGTAVQGNGVGPRIRWGAKMTYWAQPLCFRALQHQLRMADINDGKGSLVWYQDNEWCWKCVPKNEWCQKCELYRDSLHIATAEVHRENFQKLNQWAQRHEQRHFLQSAHKKTLQCTESYPVRDKQLKIVTSIVTEWRKLQSAESYPHKQVGLSKRLLPAAALGGEGGPS